MCLFKKTKREMNLTVRTVEIEKTIEIESEGQGEDLHEGTNEKTI